MTDNPAHGGQPMISHQRLVECHDSAYFWVTYLPMYADRNQAKADFWSITAGVLAALTGLSIFPVAQNDSPTWVKLVVSLVALTSAVSALVPRVKNYGEQAGTARVLAAQYGSVYGTLVDLVEAAEPNQARARQTVNHFNSIKEKKDGLRYLKPWIEMRIADKKGLPPPPSRWQGLLRLGRRPETAPSTDPPAGPSIDPPVDS